MDRQTIIKVFVALLFIPSCLFAAPSVSRNSGVAPLAVHFNADAAESDNSGVEPFHDYEYSWNFGDSNGGTWGLSGKSKSSDRGPIAAHVYETAGSYTATLTVKNPNTGSTISSSSFSITVTNPDTVFATTATTCVSTGSDFTGCPSGAAQVTTSSLSGLSGYTDAGERVLLKRGDSWTVSSNISFPNNSGPVHIGAFGTCSSPDELGICSNAPQVTLGAGVTFLDSSLKADWRLADINFSGDTAFFSGGRNPRNVLVQKISMIGGGGILIEPNRTSDSEWIDGISVVSTRITSPSVMGVWIGSERLVFMGNELSDGGTSHVVRVWQSYQGVFSHNRISGAVNSVHALKFHGPMEDDSSSEAYRIGAYAQTGASGLRYPSKFNVIANNTFGGNRDWAVTIGPQNGFRDERVSDIIFEKNKIFMDYNATGAGDSNLVLGSRYVTVRNNIFDGTGAGADVFCIHAGTSGISFSSGDMIGLKVYNNTFYSQTPHSGWGVGVWLQPKASSAVVKNNYVSFPNASTDMVIYDQSTGTVESNNVLTSTPHFSDPDNVSPLLRNFAITSSATVAIDQGYEVPIRDDYTNNCRTGLTYDVGAYEYGASPCQVGYAQVGNGSGGFSTGGSGSFQQ